MTIKTTQVEQSGITAVDINNLSMGLVFTDHMFVCDFENGCWSNARIEPLVLIPTHPAAMALHYGQAIFEGMKATLGINGRPLLFRPQDNADRFNFSARRMGMPEVPEALFMEALTQFVALERKWIPTREGSALYLRPFMYADEPFIGMRAANKYKFIIIASPAGPFFSKPIRLYAETHFIRAAIGGTGEAKAAGNYAAAILPTEVVKKNGYDQILWLDPVQFEYIQEVGTMNIFFKIDGKIITPNLNGAILNGITRLSAIELLRDWGFEVEERLVSMTEILHAAANNTLEEAFGTGTAVSIAPIERIAYKDKVIGLPANYITSAKIKKALEDIKTQKVADKFSWLYPL